MQDAPDIIMFSGRRTAPLAIYLKKIFKNQTKIIQIMRPNLSPKEFDLIILPQHDNYRYICACLRLYVYIYIYKKIV